MFIYGILEKAINRVLQWDPDTLAYLAKLQGKVVKVTLTDWQLDIYLIIQERGVHLTGEYSGFADTAIRGKLSGLIQVSRSGASGPALFDQGIEITGDAELGEKIRHILRRMDIDVEEILSQFIGDTAAHAISWRAKRLVETGKQIWGSLGLNIREYCQLETRCLPTRVQVEEFYKQVSDLRDGVDRAMARIARIEGKL